MASLLRHSPALLPLTQIHATLTHAAPRLLAVSEIVHLISCFADVSVRFTPARAAASGSVRLFRRVAARLMDPSVDAIERDYSLCRALEAAIKADDLAIVQVIHDLHPERLDTHSIGLALQLGSLELVEWVFENRCDKMCTPAGIGNFCMACAKEEAIYMANKDASRVFSWLVEKKLVFLRANTPGAVTHGTPGSANHRFKKRKTDTNLFGGLSGIPDAAVWQSVDGVRWYDQHGLLPDSMVNKLICFSLQLPKSESLSILKYLFQRGPLTMSSDTLGSNLIAAACHRDNEAVVEFVLESHAFAALRPHFVYEARERGAPKELRWDREFEETQKCANELNWLMTVSKFACHQSLGTLKRLVAEGKVTSVHVTQLGATESEEIELLKWIHTTDIGMWSTAVMDFAAARGHLQVVQWLHENRREGCTKQAIDQAAHHGHFHVVEWLIKNRSEGCTPQAMTLAAACGHLAVVGLLYESYGALVSIIDLMVTAAVDGHLDVLRWCLDRGGCARCVLAHLLSINFMHGNVLCTLRWLDKYSASAADGCHGQCLTTRYRITEPNLASCALTKHNLPMMDYILEHHPDLFEWSAKEATRLGREMVLHGHLAIVQWLHAKIPHRFDWSSLAELAEKAKHATLVTWFRSLGLSSQTSRNIKGSRRRRRR